MSTPLRIITSIAFLSLTVSSVTGQNGTPYWSTLGNSNATVRSKLGTTNSVPLILTTNNQERLRIDINGKVGINTSNPTGKLTILGNGTAPAASWVSSGVPVFAGFGESTAGNADHILAMASNVPSARAVFLGRKSRGTLTAPTAVQNNDYLLSLFASGYDGGAFQSPAAVDFFVDGTVSSGKVPARISLSTGSSASDRTERLKVGSTGDFNFNNGQLFLQQATGDVGIGTSNPSYRLEVKTTSSAIHAEGQNFGVVANADETFGFGVYSRGQVGVYAYGSSNGIFATAPSSGYAGYFSGNVYATGTYTGSDEKLKQHIEEAPPALALISQLKPKRYEYRQEGNFKAMNLPSGQHFGLIAQDVEKVLPNLVKASKFQVAKAPRINEQLVSGNHGLASPTQQQSVEFKAVNYTELIPVLVKGIQELEGRVNEQDSINKMLLQLVNELQTQVVSLTSGSSRELNDKGMLGQSIPNPARQLTSIAYRLPEGSRQAYISVIDNAGRLIHNLRVTGSGNVNIGTVGLSSGIYHYSLIVDGRIIDTKQLLITK